MARGIALRRSGCNPKPGWIGKQQGSRARRGRAYSSAALPTGRPFTRRVALAAIRAAS
jgi:hypothetical protein